MWCAWCQRSLYAFYCELRMGLSNQLNIRQRVSTAYHPQTDGQSERSRHTIEHKLRSSVLGDDTQRSRFNLCPNLLIIACSQMPPTEGTCRDSIIRISTGMKSTLRCPSEP